MLAQAIPQFDPSMTSGWVGAGLLGAVLAWLMFVHIPSAAKQLRELLDLASRERETERVSRHEVAEKLRGTIDAMMKEHQAALTNMDRLHREESAVDRAAFLDRNKHLEDAINRQTAELKLVLGTICRYYHDREEGKGKKPLL